MHLKKTARRSNEGQGAFGPALAVASMSCMQIGTAVSVPFLIEVGPTAATGMRLVGAAALLLLFTRPAIYSLKRPALLAGVFLGIAMCGMSLFFAQAVS